MERVQRSSTRIYGATRVGMRSHTRLRPATRTGPTTSSRPAACIRRKRTQAGSSVTSRAAPAASRILDARASASPAASGGLGQIEAAGGAARMRPLVPAQGATLEAAPSAAVSELAWPGPMRRRGRHGRAPGRPRARCPAPRLETHWPAGVRLGQRGRGFAHADALGPGDAQARRVGAIEGEAVAGTEDEQLAAAAGRHVGQHRGRERPGRVDEAERARNEAGESTGADDDGLEARPRQQAQRGVDAARVRLAARRRRRTGRPGRAGRAGRGPGSPWMLPHRSRRACTSTAAAGAGRRPPGWRAPRQSPRAAAGASRSAIRQQPQSAQ